MTAFAWRCAHHVPVWFTRSLVLCFQRKKDAVTYWTCSVRSKANTCPAFITERGGCFTRGCKDHTHQGDSGIAVSTKLSAQVCCKMFKKTPLFKAKFEHKSNVVFCFWRWNKQPAKMFFGLQQRLWMRQWWALAKRQICHCQKTSSAWQTEWGNKWDQLTPLTWILRCLIMLVNNQWKFSFWSCSVFSVIKPLSLQLQEEHIPADFIKKDIKVKGKRHLVFATPKQLELLATAKSWYCDATFKIVQALFTKLFSVYAFVKSEGSTKQMPLAFALMPSRRKKDYRKVCICMELGVGRQSSIVLCYSIYIIYIA